MSMTIIAATAAFTAAAGAGVGYGVAAWRGLQRVGSLLCGVNPDIAGYPEIKLPQALAVGAFLGAAVGGTGGLLYTNGSEIMALHGNTAVQNSCIHAGIFNPDLKPVQDKNGQWRCEGLHGPR
jgi:hypothetical protein